MAQSISEYLIQIQRITKKNLELLKAINDSFYTKAQHLSVTVDGEKYVIPSFLSIENRLNTLQSNFENLVNAPRTGEAAFDMGGATQHIQMKTFSNIPHEAFDQVADNQYTTFDFTKNDLFKDLCTPQPYVRMDLSNIPTDITKVNVKKVVMKSDRAKAVAAEMLGDKAASRACIYADLIKRLEALEKDTDFQEYDSIKDLPVRYGLGSGSYRIKSIYKNYTDDAFDEYYVMSLDNVSYFTHDNTIERTLKVGDRLLSHDEKCRMEITDIKMSDKTVTVRVMDGGYVNLVTEDQDSELCEIYYLNETQFDEFKYINIPLEEDQYVAVFVAPISLNTQASWATGVIFNVYNMSTVVGTTDYYYKDYYDKFVNNAGDVLFDLTDMFDTGLNNYSEADFRRLTEAVPVVQDLEVMQINSHLNNSKAIKSIYGLYDQKSKYKDELGTTQTKIDEINSILANLDFTDTTESRTVYEQQLKELNKTKKELSQNLINISKEISDEVVSSDTPIDNPKYRIRGMFDYQKFLADNNISKETVTSIEVQYRYKNPTAVTGNAVTLNSTIGGNAPIFSDWCVMKSGAQRYRQAFYEGPGVGFSYKYEDDTSSLNIPSFNQIDIPISQGETVDIRLRCVYNTGQPLVTIHSAWSDVVNIAFPEELKMKMTILDIIEENNNDIKKDQFKAELISGGVTDHVEDRLVDQDVTFFHHPDYIASGFYTEERRIIPLKDKLQTMNADITELRDEVLGTSTTDLSVSITDSVSLTDVLPYTPNIHNVPSYTSQTKINHIASEVLNLTFTNRGKHTIKLFSIFPGDASKILTPQTQSLYNPLNYVTQNMGVFVRNEESVSQAALRNMVDRGDYFTLQHLNQWTYFRINDIYDGTKLYTDLKSIGGKDVREVDNMLFGGLTDASNKAYIYETIPTTGVSQNMRFATLFPSLSKWNDICIDSTDGRRYKLLQPGEFLTIPIVVNYAFIDYNPGSSSGSSSGQGSGYGGGFLEQSAFIDKTISFDVRTSLYTDPINYTVTVRAKYADTLSDKIKKQRGKNKYTPTVVEGAQNIS